MDPLICVLSRSDGGGLLDDVNLTDTTKHYLALDEFDFSEPGVIRVGLHIVGASRDEMVANYQAIEAKLREAVEGAAMRGPWVTLEVAYRTTASVFYDITSGTLTPGVVYPRQGRMRAQLELRCLPWARGAALAADAVTATLTNGSAQFLRQDVPGDLPALVRLEIEDVSTVGVINRIRLARRAARAIAALGDFDPWIDVAQLTGASTQADATAFGGGYIHRTMTSTGWSDLARAVMPSGVLNRGARDLWARVYDTATALSAPTSLTATAQRKIASVRQSISDVTGAIAPVWTSTTLDGSYLLGIIRGADTGMVTPTVGTAPSGYTTIIDGSSKKNRDGGVAATALGYGVYLAEDAPPNTGSVSMSMSGEDLGTEGGVILELANVGEFLGELGTVEGYAAFANFDPPSAPALLVAIAIGMDSGGTVTPAIGGGFTTILSTAGFTIGVKRATSTGPVRATASTTNGTGAVLLNVLAFAETDVPQTYQLESGGYGFRVRGRDKLGTLGNATATSSLTLTEDQEAAQLSWVAPSGDVGSYNVTYSQIVNGATRYYEFDTPDASTSYLLSSTEGHIEVSGLPATTGAVAPPARLRLKLGTTGTPTGELSDLSEIVLTGAGAWRHIRVASARDLPPVGEMFDGDRPEWAIEAQIRSANGLSATVRLDCYWMAAHDEPQATIEYPGLALGTKHRWVIETDRRGRHMNAWLEVIATGAEAGRLKPLGAYTLAPGDNIIALLFELAGGLSDLTNAKATVGVTVMPRLAWQDGGA